MVATSPIILFIPRIHIKVTALACRDRRRRWLGHVTGKRIFMFWITLEAMGKLDAHDIFDYSDCKLAKFSALPFSNSVFSFNAQFDLVHSDVWGPSVVSIK
nr:Gag-Pol polyprotein [Tanacetum cinerariifolium]